MMMNFDINLIPLLAFMLISLCDIMIAYFLAIKLVKRLAVFDFKNILIAVLYAITFGTISYLTDRSVGFQILAIVAQFVIVYLNVKRGFVSSLIAFGLTYSIFVLFQTLLVVIMFVFTLETCIITTVVAQILTTIFAIVVYKLIPTNKLFAFIEKHLVLKLVIFILAFIVVLFVLYYNISVGGDFWVVLAVIGLMISIFISLYTLGREIHRRTYIKPLNEYDENTSFYGKLIKAYKEEDYQQIKILEELEKKNNLDSLNLQLGKSKENILAFINHKQAIFERKIEIESNVVYYKDHHTVGIDILIKMLEILLDNALESDTNKPILIKIRVDLGNILIEVSNEYQMTTPDAISRMLNLGFSTKGANRGFGLDNLSRTVKAFSGEVIADYDYNKTMRTNYLTFMIEI